MYSNSSISTILGFYSALILISVYFLEFVMGFKPCDLCTIQRYPYFILIILAIVLNLPINNIKSINNLIVPIVIISCIMAGLFISIYHFGIENQLWRNLSSCSDQLLGKNINTNNLLINLDKIEPNCSDPVKIFGLSISSYNVGSNFLMLLFVIYSFFIIKNKKN